MLFQLPDTYPVASHCHRCPEGKQIKWFAPKANSPDTHDVQVALWVSDWLDHVRKDPHTSVSADFMVHYIEFQQGKADNHFKVHCLEGQLIVNSVTTTSMDLAIGDYLIYFNSTDLRGKTLDTYAELTKKLHDETICTALFFRPPVPPEYLVSGIQCPKPTKESVHCVGCDKTFDCSAGGLKTLHQHLIKTVHKLPVEKLVCQFCKVSLRAENFDSHPCTRLQKSTANFATYTLKATDSKLVQLLISSGRPEFHIAAICEEENYAIANFFPPTNLPVSWKQNAQTYEHFQSCANISGVFFLQKILCDKLKSGGLNSIMLRRNIKILDQDGNVILYLTEEVLKPKSKYLLVSDIDDDYFEVSLTQPPNCTAKAQELDSLGLKVYSQYLPKNGFPYSPHRYPKEVTKDLNRFVKPYLFEEKVLRNLVGMSVERYWRFVDSLADTPISRLINMPMENLFLMFRLKLRQNWSNLVLGGLFYISVDVVQERFITVTIYINHLYHPLPRLWTASEVTEEQLDAAYELMSLNLPPLFQELKDRIADPTIMKRTKTAVISIDSIKIRIVKTSNRTKQSASYYDPKGCHNITETHAATLLGEIVWVSSMGASTSPRNSDSMLVMNMLDHDERMEADGKPLTHGLTRLLRGTKKTKVVVVTDLGYVKLPHQCKTDHLESLENWCARNGVVLLSPRLPKPKPKWILQFNPDTRMLEKTSTEDLPGVKSLIKNEKKVVTVFRKNVETQFASMRQEKCMSAIVGQRNLKGLRQQTVDRLG